MSALEELRIDDNRTDLGVLVVWGASRTDKQADGFFESCAAELAAYRELVEAVGPLEGQLNAIFRSDEDEFLQKATLKTIQWRRLSTAFARAKG